MLDRGLDKVCDVVKCGTGEVCNVLNWGTDKVRDAVG